MRLGREIKARSCDHCDIWKKKPKCASSNFTGPGKRVFKPVDQRECTDPSAHRELIFVAGMKYDSD